MDHTALFSAHRSSMLATAFHITGSRHDAEDVVQDAWGPWSRTDVATIDDPRAFLCVMASRLALNAVRAQRRRRESYIGPWVPEPIVDDGSPEWAALHRDGLGQALDFVLSTLTPEQATAYVLRKVLDVDYPSIAEVLGSTPVAARQLVSRAQRAVSAALGPPDGQRAAHDARALSLLADAVLSGDVERVAALLAPDVVAHSDGGGRAWAATRPVVGADRVARFLIGIASSDEMTFIPSVINGSAGVVISQAGMVTTTVTLHAEGGEIRSLYFVRNPEKLASVNRSKLSE